MKYLITIHLLLGFQYSLGQMVCGGGLERGYIDFFENPRTKIDSVKLLKSNCRLLYMVDELHFATILMNCANDSIVMDFGFRSAEHPTSVRLLIDFMDFAIFEVSREQSSDSIQVLLSVNKNDGGRKILGMNPYFISKTDEMIIYSTEDSNTVIVHDFSKNTREVYDLPESIGYSSRMLRVDQLSSSGFNIRFYDTSGKLTFVRIERE